MTGYSIDNPEQQDDLIQKKAAALFKRFAFKKPVDKPLLPTLCHACYSEFEEATLGAVEAVDYFISCYCPHTQCLAVLEIDEEGTHRISLQGPIDESTAQALVNNHFVDPGLDGCDGTLQ
ncbi:MAG: hypothetical protein ACR65R_19895 [Methylomicrobium sp.]